MYAASISNEANENSTVQHSFLFRGWNFKRPTLVQFFLSFSPLFLSRLRLIRIPFSCLPAFNFHYSLKSVGQREHVQRCSLALCTTRVCLVVFSRAAIVRRQRADIGSLIPLVTLKSSIKSSFHSSFGRGRMKLSSARGGEKSVWKRKRKKEERERRRRREKKWRAIAWRWRARGGNL